MKDQSNSERITVVKKSSERNKDVRPGIDVSELMRRLRRG
jgi:hypothetical protein